MESGMLTRDPEDAAPYFDDIRDAAYTQILLGLLELVQSRLEDFNRITKRDRIWLQQGGFSPHLLDAYEQLTNELWLTVFHGAYAAEQAAAIVSQSKAITPRRPSGGRPSFPETP